MKILSKSELEELREKYSIGARVELVLMNDPYTNKLSPGDKGTIIKIDDIGTIHVKWDCGSSLGVVYGEDLCRVIEENTENTQTNQASQKPGDAPHE